jgi:hypothetical protein
LGNRKPLPQHGKLNPALSLKCQSILQKKSCAAVENYGGQARLR